MTFVEGEQTLSAWMALHAHMAWIERLHPGELEDYLIGTVDLPLNLQGNSHNPFHPQLAVARAACNQRRSRCSAFAARSFNAGCPRHSG